MPGWYPSIPGWHIDDFNRVDKLGSPWHGQPALFDPWTTGVQHMLACVEAEDHPTGSLTEFFTSPTYWSRVRFEDALRAGQNAYQHMHEVIEAALERCESLRARVVTAEPNRLYFFGFDDIHRATPAKHAGFRMFIRASRFVRREHANQVRKQCNVYITSEGKGW